MKIDKILAFGIATFLSSLLSFSGQKFWVFKTDVVPSSGPSEEI
jgi:hypothetical protein